MCQESGWLTEVWKLPRWHAWILLWDEHIDRSIHHIPPNPHQGRFGKIYLHATQHIYDVRSGTQKYIFFLYVNSLIILHHLRQEWQNETAKLKDNLRRDYEGLTGWFEHCSVTMFWCWPCKHSTKIIFFVTSVCCWHTVIPVIMPHIYSHLGFF